MTVEINQIPAAQLRDAIADRGFSGTAGADQMQNAVQDDGSGLTGGGPIANGHVFFNPLHHRSVTRLPVQLLSGADGTGAAVGTE